MRALAAPAICLLAGGCAALLGVETVDYAEDAGVSDASPEALAEAATPLDGATDVRGDDSRSDGGCPPNAFACVDFEDGGAGPLSFFALAPSSAQLTVGGDGYLSTRSLLALTPALDAELGQARAYVDLPLAGVIHFAFDLRIDSMDVSADVELAQLAFADGTFVTLLARHGSTPEIGLDTNGAKHVAALPGLQTWNHVDVTVDIVNGKTSATFGGEGGTFGPGASPDAGAAQFQVGIVFTDPQSTLGPWIVHVDNVEVDLR